MAGRGKMVLKIGLSVMLLTGSRVVAQQPKDKATLEAQRALRREVVAGPQSAGCPIAPVTDIASAPIGKTDFVQLERIGGGWGAGSTYTVRIAGNGDVTWDLSNAAQFRDVARRHVDPVQARKLIDRFRQGGFFGLCGVYTQTMSDATTAVGTVGIGLKLKQVHDYAYAGPAWLRELDTQADALVGIRHP